ncbi:MULTISPECIES: POTRA domain-containing protein [unclassified Pseudomonas]|uniref:ShlB/FhaC/HecB family hemolysin secretion/activation protein n=1 Tax=unclassified Pseudomonas TaxID=196821 RepID=UPI002448FC0F|nr:MULTISPECIES: POTRA domain-containing protein [unclassified Pseudomonas]MDH0305326.1 ShlB/FhaC/HecB family hemolysin secretion/activation protein [Pseudomonas sp. GD04091]MDH1986852.1 ShlB/FhaC/HecB family hemolysin secretion/activation protein [Pseudomonas sp. GD03689]
MRLLLVTMLALTWAGLARAEPLPSFLNSNETERRLPTPNLPVDAYRPGATSPQVPTPDATGQQPLLMSTRVTVRKVRFEGGTVYPLSELRDHYQPVIGRDVSLAELIDITRRLTQRYQQDGYLLSYAYLPPQDFADGRVRVVLVEGYIRDYQVEGDVGGARAYLEKLLDRLKAERPLTRKSFERYTSLAGRIPGLTFQAQVPPPGTTDGATRLVAQVSRKPFTTTLSLNDGSRDDLQALLGASSNAQTRFAEQLSASVLVPPGEDKEHYNRLDYSQFLDAEGSQLLLSASRYRSDPKARIRLDNGIDLTQHRENERYSLGISQSLIASPSEWLEVVGRFYVVNDRIDYQVVGYPLQLDSRTDIRALSFEGDWRKAEARRLRILSAGVYQGLDRLGANTNAGYDLDFLRLRVSGVQSDNFTDNWQGVASAAAYWSNDSLPDSERAVFGGQNFGRGYPSDQGSGDKGWGLAYEFNYSVRRDAGWFKVVQPYVALDMARAWFNELDVKDTKMSSAALGLRFGDARYYNIAVEVAKPMSDIALDSFNRRPRLNLSFSYQL